MTTGREIVCPTCQTTTWKRVEEGMVHAEDILDSDLGTAYEDEDDHYETDSTYLCLNGHEPGDDLYDRVVDAFADAVWT